MSLNCVLIGAGNLATHLGQELHKNGFRILQVYSRTENSAQTLAGKINSDFVTNPKQIVENADIYFIALKDFVVGNILPQINFRNNFIVHCSGSLPLSALEKYSENTGVLYPLQTFTRGRDVTFSKIPVFIEANSKKNLAVIRKIASELSGTVKVMDSEKRKVLHVAAVFACNFVNHLYTVSGKLLDKHGLEFEVLKPLIKETTGKIMDIPPFEAQTGPAVRFDKMIIEKHLEVLSDDEELAGLYKMISKSIFDFCKNQG